ncbi:ATP-dependent Clp protease ATP-binding subunit [Deminuibacter soli]|uniref:ATP-dependent Clp protease ATP-binding subunit n=1 Tax=Deminuibacter soli TaxID=2291815 RepID=A0A3E1NCP3_9BACT|nr:ATP-dependent Clp protease ATP-binding subunit [Deminuibacter soli]RFM25597.1 ATP-dependent Clp protease ATP-binding subunit [Deminuibacter soli]
MLLNLNESVQHAVHVAKSLAKERHHGNFDSAHLLCGLLHKETGFRPFLQSIGKDVNYLYDWAEVRMDEIEPTAVNGNDIKGSLSVHHVFEEADNIRVKLGLDLVMPVCVLAALSKPNIGFPAEQLKSYPIKEKELLDLYLDESDARSAIATPVAEQNGNAPAGTAALARYTIDRTALVKANQTDPIIGRDKEIRMVMEILCRRSKPNVIITGDAGVGKTALVDGLAQQIVNGEVPANLQGALLLELDTGSLIAGASYKGEVEDRLKNIIKEIKAAGKIILFIDEIHALLDAKGAIGSGAGNLLKPELARGEITVIGATTQEEYRKIIEPEQAFSRRFEVVQVKEPDMPTAVRMLEVQREKYEQHHQLTVEHPALEEAVRLAKRYLKDRRLPDAAFDLLDRTMAAIKMMQDTSAAELQQLQTQWHTLQQQSSLQRADLEWLLNGIQNKLSPVLLGRLDMPIPGDNEEDAVLQQYIQQALERLRQLAAEKTETVTAQDVAAVIAFKTGIPIGKIQTQEKEKLLNMEAHLKQRVVGQDHALQSLAAAILESRSGLGKKGQPIGSFFLLGPTGTGKTELAKSIAAFLFNDEKAMIRFDMSEFKEEHSAALLYGAPPGYVGYEEGGLLVNKIRQQPYTVLLFDEIEKAHASVFDTFLQIMDEGHMHDRLGKEGDFSNALILFTSNIGSEWIAEQFGKGQLPASNQLMELMTRYFRPEFLARLSEIVPFAPISEENVVKIFDIQLQSLLDALDKQGIALDITPEAKKKLALSGFTPQYGARQISGVIRSQLRRPISRLIISGELTRGAKLTISDSESGLVWEH